MTDNLYRQMLDGWDQSGWVKEMFESMYGDRHCLAGRARMVVAGGRERFAGDLAPPEMPELAQVIKEQFPERICAATTKAHPFPSHTHMVITEFNDHPFTTFADVALVTEKAAIKVEEQA